MRALGAAAMTRRWGVPGDRGGVAPSLPVDSTRPVCGSHQQCGAAASGLLAARWAVCAAVPTRHASLPPLVRPPRSHLPASSPASSPAPSSPEHFLPSCPLPLPLNTPPLTLTSLSLPSRACSQTILASSLSFKLPLPSFLLLTNRISCVSVSPNLPASSGVPSLCTWLRIHLTPHRRGPSGVSSVGPALRTAPARLGQRCPALGQRWLCVCHAGPRCV